MIVNWLLHTGGLDDGSGAWYLFWSGLLGGIEGLAFFGTFYTLARKHNCEIHGCWRIGKHGTQAGHMLCRAHHPDDHLTVEAAHAAHYQSAGR